MLNFGIFLLELIYGLIENSAALLSDSAHNVGDAIILGSSLLVINSSHKTKAKLALTKCILWGSFGLLAFYQVYISIKTGIIPSYMIVSWIGLLALLTNILSASILVFFKDNDINIKSAYVCCRNDALGNILIIISGYFVYRMESNWPDIIVGSIIVIVILISAYRLGVESYMAIKTGNYSVEFEDFKNKS